MAGLALVVLTMIAGCTLGTNHEGTLRSKIYYLRFLEGTWQVEQTWGPAFVRVRGRGANGFAGSLFIG